MTFYSIKFCITHKRKYIISQYGKSCKCLSIDDITSIIRRNKILRIIIKSLDLPFNFETCYESY